VCCWHFFLLKKTFLAFAGDSVVKSVKIYSTRNCFCGTNEKTFCSRRKFNLLTKKIGRRVSISYYSSGTYIHSATSVYLTGNSHSCLAALCVYIKWPIMYMRLHSCNWTKSHSEYQYREHFLHECMYIIGQEIKVG
jgi:hypothetical protein